MCDESAAAELAVEDAKDGFVNAVGLVAEEVVVLLDSLDEAARPHVSQTVDITGSVPDVVVGLARAVELPLVRPKLLAVDKQQEPVPSVSQQ